MRDIIEVLIAIFGEFLLVIIVPLFLLLSFFILVAFWLIFKKIGILGMVLIVYIGILVSLLGWNPKFFDTPLVYPFRILGFVLLVIGVIILIVAIIRFGWGHPKWYVKLYAVICGIWESIVGIAAIGDLPSDPMELIEFSICFIPPLIPLWYLRRKSEIKFTDWVWKRFKKDDEK